jgi:hypothetical protein
MSDVRGSAAGVSNVTPILDDEATFTMDGIVPASGTFKPTPTARGTSSCKKTTWEEDQMAGGWHLQIKAKVRR